MSKKQIKILCIEDNTEYGIIYQRVFEQDGYEVFVEETGKAGLKKAIEIEPDIIIVDHLLPGYSGMELSTEIRKKRNLQDIPILLTYVIGHGWGDPYGEWERQSPLNKIILKPVRIQELREKIVSLLEISRRTNRS
jgi:response regulator RpfG family c-di-GMP phosphodiesterase